MSPWPELADPNADLGNRDRETERQFKNVWYHSTRQGNGSQVKSVGSQSGWQPSEMWRQRRNRLVQKLKEEEEKKKRHRFPKHKAVKTRNRWTCRSAGFKLDLFWINCLSPSGVATANHLPPSELHPLPPLLIQNNFAPINLLPLYPHTLCPWSGRAQTFSVLLPQLYLPNI